MPKLSIETCIAALNRASLNHKSAFQTELAVGLSMFMIEGDASKASKRLLMDTYANAGCDCVTVAGNDYKTVNRRVNATADLFNKLSVSLIKKWAGNHVEENVIDAVIVGLEPYELCTVMDVVRLCAPPAPVKTTGKKSHAVVPDTSILQGPDASATGQNKVVAMFRRAADKVEHGAFHIETKHLALMIPPSTTRDELVEMAGRLLTLAEEKKREPQAA